VACFIFGEWNELLQTQCNQQGDLAIVVDGLGKQYTLGQKQRGYRTLRETIMERSASSLKCLRSFIATDTHSPESQNTSIWALKDVSFKIYRGEVVGLIGRNGAGKSTILKVLSEITEPSEGSAIIHGRVGCLLEIGTGFHPELTGRENIFLNGAILGMAKSEIEQKFEQIVDFAEVEKFLDTPVKHYSSGMYLRLAFGVAAHLEPDILIVDEVLAVGDAAFQKKCLGKMHDVSKGGRTVLFVSHNMGAIAQLCTRVLWLNEGRLKLEGPPHEVIGAYLSAGETPRARWTLEKKERNGHPKEDVVIESVQVLDQNRNAMEVGSFSQNRQIQIAYCVAKALRNVAIVCRITDPQGNIVWTSWDTDSSEAAKDIRMPGLYTSTCVIPGNWLRPGRYRVSAGALVNNVKLFCFYENIVTFDISEVGYYLNTNRQGIVTPLLEWQICRSDVSPESAVE
jgi:lipopolysaccharide transport system ATP-binding protein